MPETTQFSNSGNDAHVDGALPPNTILLARYKIMGVLGGGGQGAVYQARDLNFPDARRLVAVKEMHVTSADPTLRASTMRTFQREANILATLSHPAIPKIYDFFDQNDRAYLVMEYINGNDLEELLFKTKSLPADKIIDWAIDLCDVLHYLHSNTPEPIIFRDMKPANIMIDSQGRVRLIDFGIAKIFVSGVKHTMIGTEGYSAPEQYKGNANPLSDIYSLGAALHHVITRKDPRLEPPFSFAERPIQQLNPDFPTELARIIDRALAFEPENRYQSCADMKDALLALRYRPVGLASAQVTEDTTGTQFFVKDGEDGGIAPRWVFKTEDEIRCSPIVHDGMAFIGSYDTNIWAVRVEDGSFVWKYATEGGIASSPIIEPSTKQILFGSEDHSFVSLDHRDGKLNWRHITGDRVRSTASIAHGHVFFGSDDGKVYALMANNGRPMWEYNAEAEVRSTPCVTNERIIFGTEAGEVVGLELNGQRKWSYRTKKNVTSSPVVDLEGVCYVGSQDGVLYAIDAASGYSHWRIRTNGPIISSPKVVKNLIYFGSADGKMYCVNTQTGKEKWTATIGKPIVSSPTIYNNAVYFGSVDHFFYCLDASTGREIWKFETQGPITSTACISNDVILFGSLDKTLYALPLVSY